MAQKKIFLLVTILLFIGAAIFFLPSDEKRIKDNLGALAEYCSSAPKEPALEALKKANMAAKLCNEPCEIHFESFKIDRQFSVKDILDNIIIMKKRLPDTTFSFHDTNVYFPAEKRAEITTTLRLTGKTMDEQFSDAYEIDITASQIDGNWLFSSFTVVEFMTK